MDINEILGRQINSVKELKSAISELQNSLIGVDTESEQYKTTSQQLAAAQAELTKVTRAGKEENNAAADSIRGMEKEYKALYDQYKMLTDEQRNSDIGKNMAASLETLSNKLNETKKEVGNFKDNIGRYAESAGEAFNGMGLSIGGLQTPLKLATGGAKTFGTALKSLAANPIVLVITALVAILTKAADAIKKNEQLSNRLNQALAALKPVTDALANVFDFLAGMIVKAVEGMSKAVEWISKINPKWNAAVKSHKELAKATNDLTKAQREAAEVNAKKQSEVEDLRARAAAATDATEKLQLLEEAKAKQAEIDQTNLELAQEDLRIKEALAEKTANDTQAEEELAAARKKVGDLTAQASKHEKEYNEQIKTTTQAVNNQTNATNKTTVATKNYREEAKKLHEQLIESNKDEITKITEKYEKEKKLLTKYGYDTTLLTKKYENDVFKVRKEASERLKSENLTITAQTIQQLRQIYQKESPIDFLKDEIKNYQEKVIPVLRSLKREGIAVQEAYGKIDSLLVKDGSTIKSSLREILDLITDRGDFSKGTSFDYIFQQLDDLVTTQPQFKKAVERIKADLNEIGPEKFAEITGELKISSDYLKDYFGIVVQNTQQAGNQIVIAKEKITELRGQISQLKIETSATTETENFFKQLLSMDTSLFNYEDIVKFQEEGERKILEVQKKGLEEELRDFKGTQDQKLEMMQQYYNIAQQLRQKDWEATQALSNLQKERMSEMVESLIDMTDKMGAAMSTYRSSQETVIDSQVKAGQIDEKEARKRKKRLLDLQAVETAFSIATITADAASGIFSIWKGYASEVGTINPQTAAAAGPAAAAVKAGLDAKSLITAVAKTASLASTAAAQIAAARGGYIAAKNNFEAEGAESSSAGVAATPVLIDSRPYEFARTIQTQEEEDELNKQYFVSVVDIESALDHRVRVTDESSF